MLIIFIFLYSDKFHSISNLFLLFLSLFSQLSVRFLVCLQAKKCTCLIFTAERQYVISHTFLCGKAARKNVTHSSVDEKTRRVSWLARYNITNDFFFCLNIPNIIFHSTSWPNIIIAILLNSPQFMQKNMKNSSVTRPWGFSRQ